MPRAAQPPAKQQDAPFLVRVRGFLADCSPTERRLAESVLDFPGDLASYSASELAAHAGVSNAAVTRFIQRIGYRNFEEARLHVREQRTAGSPVFLSTRAIAGPGRVRRHQFQSIGNLQASFAGWSDAAINGMARAILKSRCTWVVGYRSSQSFASYLRWQLFQVKEATVQVPGPADTLGQSLAAMRKADVVVVFGLRRRPVGLHATLEKIGETGARILYVTDAEIDAAPEVHWHVRCACTGSGPLDDHTAVLSFCQLLIATVFELAGPAERERLQSIEAAHAGLGEL